MPIECDTGAICPLNATISTLVVERGFWRYSDRAETLYKCKEEKATNSTACAGGVPGSQCACNMPKSLVLLV